MIINNMELLIKYKSNKFIMKTVKSTTLYWYGKYHSWSGLEKEKDIYKLKQTRGSVCYNTWIIFLIICWWLGIWWIY